MGLPIKCTMLLVPLSVTMGLGFKKASNVDCKQRFRFTFATTMGYMGCASV